MDSGSDHPAEPVKVGYPVRVEGGEVGGGVSVGCGEGLYGRVCTLPVGHVGDHESRSEKSDSVMVMRWPRGS